VVFYCKCGADVPADMQCAGGYCDTFCEDGDKDCGEQSPVLSETCAATESVALSGLEFAMLGDDADRFVCSSIDVLLSSCLFVRLLAFLLSPGGVFVSASSCNFNQLTSAASDRVACQLFHNIAIPGFNMSSSCAWSKLDFSTPLYSKRVPECNVSQHVIGSGCCACKCLGRYCVSAEFGTQLFQVECWLLVCVGGLPQ